MRYIIKEKVFTLADKFNIDDELGYAQYKVEDKILSLGNKLKIYDLNGRELIYIESSYGNYTIEGDIFHYNFNILKDEKPVAWITKKWISFSDNYAVDILDEEDQLFILSIIILLDQIFYDDRNNS